MKSRDQNKQTKSNWGNNLIREKGMLIQTNKKALFNFFREVIGKYCNHKRKTVYYFFKRDILRTKDPLETQ